MIASSKPGKGIDASAKLVAVCESPLGTVGRSIELGLGRDTLALYRVAVPDRRAHGV